MWREQLEKEMADIPATKERYSLLAFGGSLIFALMAVDSFFHPSNACGQSYRFGCMIQMVVSSIFGLPIEQSNWPFSAIVAVWLLILGTRRLLAEN